MRFLYVMLATTASLAIYFYVKPQHYHVAERVVNQTYNDIFFDKDVSVRGLHVLKPEAIKKMLPIEQTVLWWNLHRSEITSKLESHPFIQKASLERCKGTVSWRCFEVRIEERTPAYLSLYGDEASILGEDGATIQSARRGDIEDLLKRFLSGDARSLTVLVGILSDGTSSDITHARFSYVHSSLKIIEGRIGKKIARAELTADGELIVRFEELPFDVQFDDTSRNAERLTDEAERLALVLNEVKGREDRVSKIDLAFSKMAVIAYH